MAGDIFPPERVVPTMVSGKHSFRVYRHEEEAIRGEPGRHSLRVCKHGGEGILGRNEALEVLLWPHKHRNCPPHPLR